MYKRQVCIGTLAENIALGALAKKTTDSDMKVYHYAEKKDFFTEAAQVLKKGDTVLVKASHGMQFPEIVEFLEK